MIDDNNDEKKVTWQESCCAYQSTSWKVSLSVIICNYEKAGFNYMKIVMTKSIMKGVTR